MSSNDELEFMTFARNKFPNSFDKEGRSLPFEEMIKERKEDGVWEMYHHGTTLQALKSICAQGRFRLTRFTDLSGDQNEMFHVIPIVEDVARMGELSGRINKEQMNNLLAACDKIRTGVIQRYGIYGKGGYGECIPYVMSFTKRSPSVASTWNTDTFRNKDLFIQIPWIENIINADGGKRNGHGLRLFKVRYDEQVIRDFFDRELTNLFHNGNKVKTETLVHLIVDQAIRYKPEEYSGECEGRLVVMVPLEDIRDRIRNSEKPIPLNTPCMHSDSICDDIIDNEFEFRSAEEETPCYLYIDSFEDRLGYQMELFMNPCRELTIEIPRWSIIGPTETVIEDDPTLKADTYTLVNERRKGSE